MTHNPYPTTRTFPARQNRLTGNVIKNPFQYFSWSLLPQITPLATVVAREVGGVATNRFVADIGTTLFGRCGSHYYFSFKLNSKC